MKKKILILPAEYPTNDNPLGGIFTKDQTNMFANNGYDVTVIYNYFISLKKLKFSNLGNFLNILANNIRFIKIKHYMRLKIKKGRFIVQFVL